MCLIFIYIAIILKYYNNYILQLIIILYIIISAYIYIKNYLIRIFFFDGKTELSRVYINCRANILM